jgi:hypothetical protein
MKDKNNNLRSGALMLTYFLRLNIVLDLRAILASLSALRAPCPQRLDYLGRSWSSYRLHQLKVAKGWVTVWVQVKNY